MENIIIYKYLLLFFAYVLIALAIEIGRKTDSELKIFSKEYILISILIYIAIFVLLNLYSWFG